MPIEIRCPGCQRLLHLAETLAGKKVRCPKCALVVPVPDVPSADPEAATVDLLDSKADIPQGLVAPPRQATTEARRRDTELIPPVLGGY